MEKISAFFARLGFPLHNSRWSWGARSDLGVLLTTWADELDNSGHYVRVLRQRSQGRLSSGLSERMDHLRTLWAGGLAGYAVLATAKDIAAQPRSILFYDSSNVRTILSLVTRSDGSVWAELGDNVPIGRLARHAAKHRLIPADGPFPEAPYKSTFRASGAAYMAHIQACRELLIDVARRGETITYAQVRAPFGLRTFELRHLMVRIGHDCIEAGEPVLTCLIIDSKTGRCSPGFFSEFRRDESSERADCFAFWGHLGATCDLSACHTAEPTEELAAADILRERAARFARVEVRPEQAAFRRRVFLAHKGACVVTGCSIPEALDAAHRKGRDWRSGHNGSADGLLLRKDIHALYDAGLVSIDGSGTVTFDLSAVAHYREYVRTS